MVSKLLMPRLWTENHKVCLVTFALFLLTFFFNHQNYISEKSSGGMQDWFFYQNVCERVSCGENYYAVAADELPISGYSTSSVFNWRTAVYSSLIGLLLGKTIAWVILTLLYVIAIIWTCACFELYNKFYLMCVYISTAFLMVSWLVIFETTYFMEPWSGVCIYMSILAVVTSRRLLALLFALLAVLLRELAIVYLVVLFIFSLKNRDRRLFHGSILCLIVFTMCMTAHAYVVTLYSTTGVGGNIKNWMYFGGISFLISTYRVSYVLLLLPPVFTNFLFIASASGLYIHTKDNVSLLGMTFLCFSSFFLIVGQPNNYYWGWLYCMMIPYTVTIFASRISILCSALTKGSR